MKLSEVYDRIAVKMGLSPTTVEVIINSMWLGVRKEIAEGNKLHILLNKFGSFTVNGKRLRDAIKKSQKRLEIQPDNIEKKEYLDMLHGLMELSSTYKKQKQ